MGQLDWGRASQVPINAAMKRGGTPTESKRLISTRLFSSLVVRHRRMRSNRRSEVLGLDLSGKLYKRRSQEKRAPRGLEFFLLRSPTDPV
jgi:hypothetical protein